MILRRGPLAGLELKATAPTLAITAICAVTKAAGMILTAVGLATAVAAVADGWQGSGDWQSWSYVPGLTAVVTGIALRAGAGWVGETAAARTAVGFERDLRTRLLARTLADPSVRVGARSLLATSRLDAVRPYLSRYLPALTATAVIPLMVIGWLLLTDALTGVIVALTVPLVPLFLALIGLHTADRTTSATTSINKLADHVAELVRGLPVLVGLGRAQDQARALDNLSRQVRIRTVAMLRTVFLSSMALELLATMSVALVAVTVGLRLVHGNLDLQTGLLLLVLAPEAYAPFRTLGATHHASEDGREAVTRIRSLLNEPTGQPLPTTPPPNSIVASPDITPPRIAITDLTVSYHDRSQTQISDLTFTLDPGRITMLEGPSGSGKSTVIAVLSGRQSDQSARMEGTIDGLDRDRLALVDQHPTVSAPTAAEEIALHTAHSRAIDPTAVLTEVGLGGLADHNPRTFSPGQLQRLALARANARVDARLANVLLLDEPTAHLDSAASALVTAAIRRRAASMTTLMITHDPALHTLADHTVQLPISVLPPVTAPNGEPAGEADRTQPKREMPPRPPTSDAPGTSTRQRLLDRATWQRLAIAAALGIAASAAAVALTATSAWLIVRAAEQPPLLTLMVAIVGVRAFGLARAILRWAERVTSHSAVLSSIEGLRQRLWEALTHRGPAVTRGIGERAVTHLVADLDRFQEQLLRSLLPPVIAAGATIVGVAIIAWLSPAAAVAVALAIAVAITATVLVTFRSADATAMRLRSDVEYHVSAAMDGAADIHVHQAHPHVLAHIASIADQQAGIDQKRATTAGATEALVTLALGLAAVAAVAIGAGQVTEGALAATGLAVLALTPLALIEPLAAIGPALQASRGLRESSRRLREVVDLPRPREPKNPQTPASQVNRLHLDNVAVAWPDGPTVVSQVNLSARPGTWTILTGPSGSGKSTILATLLAFLRPLEGSYLHQNSSGTVVDTADLFTVDTRKPIAWCPQEAHIFDGTVGANLALARPRGELADLEGRRRMLTVLDQVGLGPLLASLPNGLDSPIGAGGRTLSGGERRRLAVAQALLTERPVLVMDEPTAHLDSATSDALMSDLRSRVRDRTVIIVTHGQRVVTENDNVVHVGEEKNLLSPVSQGV